MAESNLAQSSDTLLRELAQFVGEEVPAGPAANEPKFRKRRGILSIQTEDQLFKPFRIY